MKKFTYFVLALGVVAIMAMGCSQDANLNAPEEYQNLFATLQLPAGATITSATLYLYVWQASGESIDVHRVTADWAEMTVTWDNFGGAFDPAVVASFTADAVGWHTADVTTLAQAWADGTYEDFGLLIDQVEKAFPRTGFNSKDAADFHPYLEVCYTTGGDPVCAVADCMADAYLYELSRFTNFGASTALYTGWEIDTDLEKQSVLRFDLVVEPEEQDGCSLTIGYWKTHAGFGPQADMVTQFLPIWLGDAGGAKSLQVVDAAMAVDILKEKTYGDPSNGITKLYAQLLGVKLNLANGASDLSVFDVVADADAFLADHDWTDWEDLTQSDKDLVLYWQGTLDDYNNGLIGPGHCED